MFPIIPQSLQKVINISSFDSPVNFPSGKSVAYNLVVPADSVLEHSYTFSIDNNQLFRVLAYGNGTGGIKSKIVSFDSAINIVVPNVDAGGVGTGQISFALFGGTITNTQASQILYDMYIDFSAVAALTGDGSELWTSAPPSTINFVPRNYHITNIMDAVSTFIASAFMLSSLPEADGDVYFLASIGFNLGRFTSTAQNAVSLYADGVCEVNNIGDCGFRGVFKVGGIGMQESSLGNVAGTLNTFSIIDISSPILTTSAVGGYVVENAATFIIRNSPVLGEGVSMPDGAYPLAMHVVSGDSKFSENVIVGGMTATSGLTRDGVLYEKAEKILTSSDFDNPSFTYQASTTDTLLLVDTSPEEQLTIKLPSIESVGNGFIIEIKDYTGNALGNSTRVQPNNIGTETIDGSSVGIVFSENWECLKLRAHLSTDSWHRL